MLFKLTPICCIFCNLFRFFFALCFHHLFPFWVSVFYVFQSRFRIGAKDREIFFEPLENPFEQKILTGTPFCMKTWHFAPFFPFPSFFPSFFPVLCIFLSCSFGPPGLHFRGTFLFLQLRTFWFAFWPFLRLAGVWRYFFLSLGKQNLGQRQGTPGFAGLVLFNVFLLVSTRILNFLL